MVDWSITSYALSHNFSNKSDIRGNKIAALNKSSDQPSPEKMMRYSRNVPIISSVIAHPAGGRQESTSAENEAFGTSNSWSSTCEKETGKIRGH